MAWLKNLIGQEALNTTKTATAGGVMEDALAVRARLDLASESKAAAALEAVL